MSKYNAKNERMKHDYFRFLKEADGKSDATIEGIRKSLLYFEEYTGFKDFGSLHRDQIIAFKKQLANRQNKQTGNSISKATMHTAIQHLKAFFRWLAYKPGYKSKIHVPDIGYFSLTDKEVSAAQAVVYKEPPTIEQIRKAVFIMTAPDEITRRNQALMAFTLLSGMRDSAIISLKLKHIDVEQGLIRQDPREVKTKFSKQINTFFFPVGDDIRTIVVDWINYLLKEKLFGLNDPVFPKTMLVHDENLQFKAGGLSNEHWNTTSPVREIFRQAFEQAGLRYYKPHLFRDTLVHLGQKLCKTPEQFKAWSQNLGHEGVMTTFTSYGTLNPYRQGEVIAEIGRSL